MWNERYLDPCRISARAAYKNIFGGGSAPPPPPAPTPTPPPTMPDPFDPAALEAQKKAQLAAMNTGGRQSTILTTAANRAASTIAGGAGGAKLGAS